MAEIRLCDVTKRFGRFTAVDRINLEVEDREFLVLVGPSGCGKTTTLRMIAGLEEITDGDIYIGDRKVNQVPPKDRDIAMVFQNYALYPHMSVYKNMSFGLRLRRYSKEDIKRRVEEGARILGIGELLRRKPKELSGGQRQRVAMGRAIVRRPKAFLFDEPLSNLDAKLRVQTRGELKRLHEELETTSVYVTHDQVEAMTLADRIVVMDRGLIMQVGSPLEVYNHPKNLFVAGFVGSPSMNFVEVRVTEENGKLSLVGKGIHLAVPNSLRNRYLSLRSKEVILGIRPENVHERKQQEPFEGSAVLKATVDVVEPLGAEVILLVSVGSVQLTIRVGPQTEAEPHKEMEFLVDISRMHLFDKVTQEIC